MQARMRLVWLMWEAAKAGDWGFPLPPYVCFTSVCPCLLYLYGEFRDMGSPVCVFVSAAGPLQWMLTVLEMF